MGMGQQQQWRRCSACKQPIAFAAKYWACSVSTCNRERTALFFCTLSCWEVHLPGANHREAWAVEQTAPASEASSPPPVAAQASASGPTRRIPPPTPARPQSASPDEVLIVASRLKDYIRARSGYNTSDRVLAPLSVIVRRICDDAIQNARSEGRTTVLDRDIPRS
jgi:hypothetical protein